MTRGSVGVTRGEEERVEGGGVAVGGVSVWEGASQPAARVRGSGKEE